MLKQLITYIYLKRNKAQRRIGRIVDRNDKQIYVFFNDKDVAKIIPAIEVKDGCYKRGEIVDMFVYDHTAFLWGNLA